MTKIWRVFWVYNVLVPCKSDRLSGLPFSNAVKDKNFRGFWGGLQTILPIVRISVKIRNRDNQDFLLSYLIDDAIRKTTDFTEYCTF
jgi:ribosome biogenesis protein Nip4